MNDKIISIHFNSDIAKGDDNTRIAFYANIGFFLEVAQMFEFNLRKLICYERSVKEIEKGEINKENIVRICSKYDKFYENTYSGKFTLGKIVKESRKESSISSDFFDFLDEINEFRNLLVHKIFQNNVITNNLASPDLVNEYTKKRIIPMTDKAIIINKAIVGIVDTYRTDLREYKKQFGITIKD